MRGRAVVRRRRHAVEMREAQRRAAWRQVTYTLALFYLPAWRNRPVSLGIMTQDATKFYATVAMGKGVA